MPRRVPDLRKIKALVGYEPTLALDEILRRVVDAHPRTRSSRQIGDNRSRCISHAARALPPNGCSWPMRSPSAACCSATGRDRAVRLPDIVQIESTNLCNAKCVFCPRDEMHRRQGVMDMDLFTKIVDECAALGITHVRVHNYGEPFLDRATRREGAVRQVQGHRRSRA